MTINSEGSHIQIIGKFDEYNLYACVGAMHNIINDKGYKFIKLDFSNCVEAFSIQMLALVSKCQLYWHLGIDISLTLPKNEKLERLFKNTNWAHFIDPRDHTESRFLGYTHAAAIKFRDGNEQFAAVNKTMDILLAAIKEFRRDDIRYIEWAVNEITDNVINHSQSPVGGFIQITNHRNKEQIEITVSDAGLGIPKTLRQAKPDLHSDQEALESAIKEGVTRDNSIGQGNGLYGTWKIAQKSNGTLNIYSGNAKLVSNGTTNQISREKIPISGATVCARIGYSKTVDLSEALTFKGRVHKPSDYIELHFDEDESGNITFNLKSESRGFGSRAAGEPVRRKLINLIGMLQTGHLVVDAKDINFISSSFADEVFGKLFIELGPLKFSSSIKIVNLDNLVSGLIDKAVMQRMRQ